MCVAFTFKGWNYSYVHTVAGYSDIYYIYILYVCMYIYMYIILIT